jgi:signal transduction histidine kinase
MLNTECNGGRQPAGLIASDGKMWFGTQDGVAVVDPSAVTTNPLAPPVEIESAAIDRNPVAFTESLRIGPSQMSLDITYTALSLIKSDLIRFKYKMEGLDADWIDVGSRRTAYYSYLPPGEYTFKVIAANSDGVWNTEGKSIKIIVVPPLYRRFWFIALAIACVLSLMFLIYRARVSRLERERAAQQAFSRQLIASQEEERKRIAGELHDSLGQALLVIKNRAYIGANADGNTSAACEQFDEISNSAAEAIDQVREISYGLRPSQLERFGLTAAVEEMLEQVAEASGIRFDFEIESLEGAFSSEAEINFYRIVQECANNIVKHSGATRAEVAISRDEQAIELMVRDNGKGFDPNASPTGKSGFGMTGIAERAQILGGISTIESAPESGTTVRVRIESSEK